MSDPLLIHPEDPDDDWQSDPPQGFRLHAVTAGLLALAVLAGGFWAGSVAERHHGGSSSGSSGLGALANRFAAARAGGGFGGSGAAGGAAGLTSGIVTEVQGDTLYLTDSAGNLVKVQVGSATTVSRTAPAPLTGLQVGDSVVVQGSKGSDGSVSATALRASAPGATPAVGAFAGSGGQPTAGSGGVPGAG